MIFSRFRTRSRLFWQEVCESFWARFAGAPQPDVALFFGGGPFLRFPQKWGFFREPQLQTGANSYAATSLWWLVVALSCHSVSDEFGDVKTHVHGAADQAQWRCFSFYRSLCFCQNQDSYSANHSV
jgi:hypothetical protein